MKRVLVGHRGVGKSSLLLRHQCYFPEVPIYDLDLEIEKLSGQKISDIFRNAGEAEFRKLEIKFFDELIQKSSFAVAVGGGFPLEKIPASVEVVFVSRMTDSEGRIFLNRPKINSNLGDLEDSLQLYHQRQQKFVDRADVIYHMPEGLREADEIEKIILSCEPLNVGMYLTVVKNNSFERRQSYIEFRNDLKIPEASTARIVIVSYRNLSPKLQFLNASYDWALELGPPEFDVDIVSAHEESLENLSKYSKFHLKFCPQVRSWEQLIQGYRWQQQDPHNRSFLPRGNYKWFRLLMSQKQRINFVRGFTDMNDQPSLYEVLDFQTKGRKDFGAVLGNPINHSRTPWEQGSRLSYPILAIPLEEKDYSVALPFLEKLGLKFAAVTSPLKKVAGGNSIILKNGKWVATSTDHFGFRKLLAGVPQGSIAVWGGGGVIDALKKEIPNLRHYSARKGIGAPVDILIWAAPRHVGIKFPEWIPQVIIDLNYVENSMGLEYAKNHGIKYISGLEMFFEQAKHQREFWKEQL